MDEAFAEKLSAYLNKGGKLLASWHAGLRPDGEEFALPQLMVQYRGEAPYSPDFIWPKAHLAKGLADAEHVMYDQGTLVEVCDGASFVQKVIPPVFNRTYEHFCSHLHSPSGRKEAYPGIVETAQTVYFIHPIFTTYQNWAPNWYKKLLANELARLLPKAMVSHNGPSSVQVNLLRQDDQNRDILHILHYVPTKKCKNLDILEDRLPLEHLKIEVEADRPVKSLYSVPNQEPIPFRQEDDRVFFEIERIEGHFMCALCY